MKTEIDKLQLNAEVKKYIVKMVERADEDDYKFLQQISTLFTMHFKKKGRR